MFLPNDRMVFTHAQVKELLDKIDAPPSITHTCDNCGEKHILDTPVSDGSALEAFEHQALLNTQQPCTYCRPESPMHIAMRISNFTHCPWCGRAV